MTRLKSNLQYSKFSTIWHSTFGSFTTWRPTNGVTHDPNIFFNFNFKNIHLKNTSKIFIFFPVKFSLQTSKSTSEHELSKISTLKHFDFFFSRNFSFNSFFRTPEIPHLHFFSPLLHTLNFFFPSDT